MAYHTLKESLDDLERHGQLVRVRAEVDPHLEMAEIQRRAYAAQAPAIYYERVKGSPFPAVSNLFGTMERCRFLFRHTLRRVEAIIKLKADPAQFWRKPLTFASAPFTAWKALPKRAGGGPVLAHETRIDQLPQIVGWPEDGGPFITLPAVLTEDPEHPGILHTNLGMYRAQLAGNDYCPNEEIGLHYQIHRGIGVHHAAAIRRGEPLRVSIFVGGPPANIFAAVMPLPETLSELVFAGMLGGRRFRYCRRDGHIISTDADFCITGEIDPERLKLEGPFGDHLGYYSLKHDFPFMRVKKVYHRPGAVWPFTVVGRPPQEDTTFGAFIHELTAPLVPREIPGLKAIHAVDAAGVHPLMLAIGSERYEPHRPERIPQELLTTANAILGYGQASLAKYLFIAAREDNPDLDVHDVEAFLRHVLERVDWTRDLHFQTRTTIDTLDYSGTALNQGSKVVIAAAGPKKRELGREVPPDLPLPSAFGPTQLAFPGVFAIGAPHFDTIDTGEASVKALCDSLSNSVGLEGFPLLVLVDDVEFSTRNLPNFLWTTFTRSNPSHDIHGVHSFTDHKHWGCRGPSIIDARLKPHHAPPLVEDRDVTRRVDALAGPGGELHGSF